RCEPVPFPDNPPTETRSPPRSSHLVSVHGVLHSAHRVDALIEELLDAQLRRPDQRLRLPQVADPFLEEGERLVQLEVLPLQRGDDRLQAREPRFQSDLLSAVTHGAPPPPDPIPRPRPGMRHSHPPPGAGTARPRRSLPRVARPGRPAREAPRTPAAARR